MPPWLHEHIHIKIRLARDLIPLLDQGEVLRFEYSAEFGDVRGATGQITLKNGDQFPAAPIKGILGLIERCGEPCKDLEIVVHGE